MEKICGIVEKEGSGRYGRSWAWVKKLGREAFWEGMMERSRKKIGKNEWKLMRRNGGVSDGGL
jgi:hypothetical protein